MMLMMTMLVMMLPDACSLIQMQSRAGAGWGQRRAHSLDPQLHLSQKRVRYRVRGVTVAGGR